jgi:uncharacterized membrane protein YebE (DUF533 family)
MKRLTIGVHACTETLALLIAFAWADGRLEEREKEGVLGAVEVFNLPKDLRDRVGKMLEKPLPLDQILVDTLSHRDRAFAFVAAAWLTGVDQDVDAKEESMLNELAERLGYDEERKRELIAVARDLEPMHDGPHGWAREVTALFKAIPPRLENVPEHEVEVSFE